MLNRIEFEITLNQIRQNVISADDGLKWFLCLSEADQRIVLQVLAHATLQAGAMTDDVPQAIVNSGLKSTYTPAVVLTNPNLSMGISKLINLPQSERSKGFKLLMKLFCIADGRRVVFCGDGCKHWWHKDLSDQHYLEIIREQYKSGSL